MNTMELLEIQDGPDPGLPEVMGEYTPAHVPGYSARTTLRPLQVVQPEGASFTLDGHALSWENWRMRLGFTYREGLVLHEVGWAEESGADGSGADGSGADGSGVRPIAHRLSFAEMVVPYRDPTPDHLNRTAFDVGEWGLGFMTTSLDLGCDCLGEITYVDAVLHDSAGEPTVIRNAICLHEEDAGLLFKHFDDVTGHTELRRNRRFVVNAMATVGNYDYAFRWYLGLDGSIEVEVQLHGVVSTMALAPGEEPRGSNLVDRGLAAPHHQHLFCFRLDLDVDGERNRIVEVEAEPVPMGDASPLGNVFMARRTPLPTERAARREADDRLARSWHVQSTERRNGLGGPTAYRLTPLHGTSTLLAQPGSSVARRAGYAAHTFWATAYDPAEVHPASQYPYGQRDTLGLPQWSDADRSLDDADVVVWYVAGTTHFVRPEDWPIMPVARAGFLLEPYGFFDRNPTLDVPPPHAHCAHGNGHPG
jgi:primary-amine oxidase